MAIRGNRSKRNQIFSMLMTLEEHQALEAAAKSLDLPMTEYVRQALVQSYQKESDHEQIKS